MLDSVTHLTLDRPHVSPDLILRLQKYKELEAGPAPVREAAQAMAALAETLVEPEGRLLHVLVRRVEAEGAIIVADGVRFQSRALARLLRGATEIFLILLTLGPKLENQAQVLMGEEQFLEALLLDTAGWAAMDALAKTLRGRLSSEARARGMHLTHRMAPGYADWGLEEQRALFSAFGEDSLPVQLTEACVMLPRKSISGIYGLIPATTTA
ncbi:MAG: hypothetical protein HYS69_11315 [candidate division NC10 bacterium]|nr:hypothetical protein [candidate division NC10 bacterium]